MLGEAELNSLEGQLSKFTFATKARQDALEQLTSSYGKLLDDYRALRSDFEEEKESREKYKKLARGQERNPFVLVLVDADGYVFEDSLIKAGAEGGIQAARILHDTVRDRLSRYGHEYENCRVMVRAYTNLAGLSKTLARAGLTGNEARSLAPFCANFTRAYDLFDFVDAGDKKENADNKIREMFRLFIDNAQCKHIFFAGCHDTGYLNLLTPYIGKSDKITLIRGSSFSAEFQNLGLGIDGFNGLFRHNPLDGFDARRPTLPKAYTSSSQPIHDSHSMSAPVRPPPVCSHYLRGMCKFGNNCKKLHANGGDSWRSNGHALPLSSSGFDTPVPGGSVTGVGSPGSGIALPSPGFGSSAASTIQSFPPAMASTPHVQPSVALPRPSPETANLIPVNKDGYRLDFYHQPATSQDWLAYSARIKQQKLCNEYQLKGHCRNGENCSFDHSPVPDNVKLVLRHMVHDYPCGRKGSCRFKCCNMGHICYREKCGGSSGKGGCRLNRTMHSVDPVVTQWLPAEDLEFSTLDSFGITPGEMHSDDEDAEETSETFVDQRSQGEALRKESGVGIDIDYPDPHASDLD